MEQCNIKTKVVGVDISNELTTYAIVDVRGNILAEDSFPTQDYPDVNNFVTSLSEKIVMLVEANGGYETIRSIGVSSPSASSVSGCIENAANLPWKGVVPLSAMLRDRIGLAVGDVAKSLLTLAGVHDSWGFARGNTKTKVNYCVATFDALRQTAVVRVTDEQAEKLNIVAGPIGLKETETDVDNMEE